MSYALPFTHSPVVAATQFVSPIFETNQQGCLERNYILNTNHFYFFLQMKMKALYIKHFLSYQILKVVPRKSGFQCNVDVKNVKKTPYKSH